MRHKTGQAHLQVGHDLVEQLVQPEPPVFDLFEAPPIPKMETSFFMFLEEHLGHNTSAEEETSCSNLWRQS